MLAELAKPRNGGGDQFGKVAGITLLKPVADHRQRRASQLSILYDYGNLVAVLVIQHHRPMKPVLLENEASERVSERFDGGLRTVRALQQDIIERL